MSLKEIYRQAALKAVEDGIFPDEADLVPWIKANCSFDPDNLFFLVLGIGAEIGDILTQRKGFRNQVHEIMTGIHASKTSERKEA